MPGSCSLAFFNTMKILIIEDDNETRGYVSAGLKEAGHAIDSARDGYEGLLLAKEGKHDLLIVDRMLPGLDGLTLVKTLRSAGITVPVLFLTTMCGIDDRVEGLNAGADDYLVKPFAFSELSARVNALLRRPRETVEQKILQVSGLEIDLMKRSSHPREPPPQVLTEPDVNVSAHPAPIVQPLHTALSNEQTDSAVSAQCDSATVPLVFYDAVGVCIFASPT